MLTKARVGLPVGIAGLVLNGLVSGFSGLTGTILALAAGGLAGFFAARKGLAKPEGARAGALAGGVAGGVVLVGQVIGAMVNLSARFSTESASVRLLYLLLGAGAALLLWAILILVAAGMGAAVGYLATPRATAR